jgi:hypothetical protein
MIQKFKIGSWVRVKDTHEIGVVRYSYAQSGHPNSLDDFNKYSIYLFDFHTGLIVGSRSWFIADQLEPIVAPTDKDYEDLVEQYLLALYSIS